MFLYKRGLSSQIQPVDAKSHDSYTWLLTVETLLSALATYHQSATKQTQKVCLLGYTFFTRNLNQAIVLTVLNFT